MSVPPPQRPITPNRSPFVWLVGRREKTRGVLPSSVPRRDRGALYVFEWMCLIIIIGIVLTISLPVYNKAAGTARAVACSSNLQHLYQMTAMYAQDFDGVYPPLPRFAEKENALRPIQKNEEAWTERLRPYREEKKNEKQDPFACPASDDDLMTYAYNAALGGRVFPDYDPKGPPRGESEIAAPSLTYLVWDTANQGAANAIVGYRYYSGARRDGKYHVGDLILPTGAIKPGWMYPRHNGASSVLFCDGHVSRLADPGVRVEEKRNPFDPLADAYASEDTAAEISPSPTASIVTMPINK